MLDLGNRTINDEGLVTLRGLGLEALLYRGGDLSGVVAEPSDDLELYREANRRLDAGYEVPCTEPDSAPPRHMYWYTPAPYATMDVIEHCISRCSTSDEQQRCADELELFIDRGLEPLLRHLVYMVDTWRSNGVVWGVGRGSSVSSFVLYLIGINRINPMVYGLDHREFFRGTQSTAE